MYCAEQLVPANNREQTGGPNHSYSFEELFGYRHNATQFFLPDLFPTEKQRMVHKNVQ